MSRKPNEQAEKAKEMFLNGYKLVDIANQLNLPEGTIRSWKNRYKWDCNVANHKCNVANRKKGGQLNNKNAKGHGGTGPPGNKNAVKTGEFEALFFDLLSPEEKDLASNVELDKQKLLFQEIQLLTIREYRMLQRIKDNKKDFEKICSIENALTRVQEKKQRAIEVLHRIGNDDARLELETMKFEASLLKQDNFREEKENDGFMEAMNQMTSDIWNDLDDE